MIGGRTVLAMNCVLAGAERHHGRPLNAIVRRHQECALSHLKPLSLSPSRLGPLRARCGLGLRWRLTQRRSMSHLSFPRGQNQRPGDSTMCPSIVASNAVPTIRSRSGLRRCEWAPNRRSSGDLHMDKVSAASPQPRGRLRSNQGATWFGHMLTFQILERLS